MKIALLTPTFMQFSGPDRVVENEAAELTAAGHSVIVYAFRSDIRPKGYKVVTLGMPRNAFLERVYRLFFLIDLPKIINVTRKLRGFDEVWSFLYPMTILAATAKRYNGARYVYYNMGVATPELFASPFERLYMRLFNVFTNYTIRHADKTISISDFLRKQLLQETGLDGEVRYVKVDDGVYHLRGNRKKATEILEKHGLTQPVLLYVGRISPHKGVHLLLRAFEKVQEKIPSASLLIAGKHTFDGYSRELSAIAERLNKKRAGSVVFAGFVPEEEMPHYYHAADVYVTASLWEGFDIPAFAAQKCGKKVVAFDVGSHPEVVKEGKLVRKGDVEGFADAVVTVLS